MLASRLCTILGFLADPELVHPWMLDDGGDLELGGHGYLELGFWISLFAGLLSAHGGGCMRTCLSGAEFLRQRRQGDSGLCESAGLSWVFGFEGFHGSAKKIKAREALFTVAYMEELWSFDNVEKLAIKVRQFGVEHLCELGFS
ncbi:uncharacterized protein HKW66_Vig0041970 [Vigna angularis]|uniref:Uncharacterized protein n=1 Tax=Phaseolus angularis TaxID=3914 RepID=A0A8T0L0B6_PHAAN|nr:uncharacterized protein HKW66_Vig0041970 [Vigna angularis]